MRHSDGQTSHLSWWLIQMIFLIINIAASQRAAQRGGRGRVRPGPTGRRRFAAFTVRWSQRDLSSSRTEIKKGTLKPTFPCESGLLSASSRWTESCRVRAMCIHKIFPLHWGWRGLCFVCFLIGNIHHIWSLPSTSTFKRDTLFLILLMMKFVLFGQVIV